MKAFWSDIKTDFKCQHCGNYVSAARMLAGVGNRNHCPYCLWSRHLDLFEAGDRLAACKAPMRPVGLTLKRSCNKYASAASGELMLVHLCTDCDGISINRIAADDHPEAIMEVFESSLTESAWLRNQIRESKINLLDDESYDIVCRQLFGGAIRPVLSAVPTI
jgi:hypothetical protein